MPVNRHADLLRQYLEEESERPGTGLPMPFAQWLRVASVALGGALALASCGGTLTTGEATGGASGETSTAGTGGATSTGETGGTTSTARTGGTTSTGGVSGVGGADGGGMPVPYGVPFPPENCDDGVDDDGDGLVDCADGDCATAAQCAVVARCGDGQVQSPEQCDDGVNDGGYGECGPGCVLGPRCGDGVLQPSYEQCDEGAANSNSGNCTLSCRTPIYGIYME
jgi:cysteine-rich repeat protein